MKKILTSFGLSIPAMALGLVLTSQASNPAFLVSADSGIDYSKTGTIFLTIVGLLLILLAAFSIIYKFIFFKKKG